MVRVNNETGFHGNCRTEARVTLRDGSERTVRFWGMRFRELGIHWIEWIVTDVDLPLEQSPSDPRPGYSAPQSILAVNPESGETRVFGWRDIVRRTR